MHTTTILYNDTPTIKAHEKLIQVSTPLEILHLPEKAPAVQTYEEFMQYAHKYTEVVITAKYKKSTAWSTISYRCLFSTPSKAKKAFDSFSDQLDKKLAAEAKAKANNSQKWDELANSIAKHNLDDMFD